MEWTDTRGNKLNLVEMNPVFKQLLAKVMRLAKKPGYVLVVTFRKPTQADNLWRAVEVADIELTFPDE